MVNNEITKHKPHIHYCEVCKEFAVQRNVRQLNFGTTRWFISYILTSSSSCQRKAATRGVQVVSMSQCHACVHATNTLLVVHLQRWDCSFTSSAYSNTCTRMWLVRVKKTIPFSSKARYRLIQSVFFWLLLLFQF